MKIDFFTTSSMLTSWAFLLIWYQCHVCNTFHFQFIYNVQFNLLLLWLLRNPFFFFYSFHRTIDWRDSNVTKYILFYITKFFLKKWNFSWFKCSFFNLFYMNFIPKVFHCTCVHHVTSSSSSSSSYHSLK
jgi:hypothetical protein